MYEGSSAKLFRKFALPQMIGLLFNSIYIIVDGLFIGNRLGRDAMAAAAVGVPLVEILIALSMAITSGAVTYIRYIITFSPFMLYSYLLGGMARNDGRPKLAMWALTIGSLSNILLDYVFIYLLNLGIGGAALATALGPILSDVLLLPHFLKKKGCLYFRRSRFELRAVGHILATGFPSFIMEFTIGIVTFVYNTAIRFYGFGEIGLAAPDAALCGRRISSRRHRLLYSDSAVFPSVLFPVLAGGRGTDRFCGEQKPRLLFRLLPGRIQYPDDLVLAVHGKWRKSPDHLPAQKSDSSASSGAHPAADLRE
ncbi:MAG: MATE family efflux transporter [Lachnospiraceae bacterium]|nr:polysaccharide biosynthesis C-terminal domain-containing protein [Lachnospiraceae bacterium]MCH4032346.1 polysaccharide biosynthesis C-terminal domain-containing protein [Lachnospiraceae bacterium]MCH4108776.1 polysaccharide biosynthesis C-terminal domain-containing protein [Lachnospiraceae bacterium]MCI1302307.1 MATE family efflux transporter [Lachnospiraceae bacterium]MCI1331473.1 MATE family efflux transporter [Lachnospiraceae bacterium]